SSGRWAANTAITMTMAWCSRPSWPSPPLAARWSPPQKQIPCLIDPGGEIFRSAAIGVHTLHQLAVGSADILVAGAGFEAQDSVGFLDRTAPGISGALLARLGAFTGEILAPAGAIGIEPVLEEIDAVGVAGHLIEELSGFLRPQIHEIPAGQRAIEKAPGGRPGVVIELHGEVTAAHVRGIAAARLGETIEGKLADPAAQQHGGGERADNGGNIDAAEHEAEQRD